MYSVFVYALLFVVRCLRKLLSRSDIKLLEEGGKNG